MNVGMCVGGSCICTDLFDVRGTSLWWRCKLYSGEIDRSTVKCYSCDQDSYPCPQGHRPCALTNWANSQPFMHRWLVLLLQAGAVDEYNRAPAVDDWRRTFGLSWKLSALLYSYNGLYRTYQQRISDIKLTFADIYYSLIRWQLVQICIPNI